MWYVHSDSSSNLSHEEWDRGRGAIIYCVSLICHALRYALFLIRRNSSTEQNRKIDPTTPLTEWRKQDSHGDSQTFTNLLKVITAVKWGPQNHVSGLYTARSRQRWAGLVCLQLRDWYGYLLLILPLLWVERRKLEIPYKIFQILQGQCKPDRQQSNRNEFLREKYVSSIRSRQMREVEKWDC